MQRLTLPGSGHVHLSCSLYSATHPQVRVCGMGVPPVALCCCWGEGGGLKDMEKEENKKWGSKRYAQSATQLRKILR